MKVNEKKNESETEGELSWRISYTGRHQKIVIRESLNQCRIVVYKLVIWLSELEKKTHSSFYINESNLETLGSTVHAFTQNRLTK